MAFIFFFLVVWMDMAFLVFYEVAAFLVNKVQAVLQKLIKHQLFIMDILRKGVYIHYIHTERGAEIGYKTGSKDNFSPYF